ncbi:hypothetical protein [Motilimonas sp. KMU-193]|uniref:hypothetical protein n=1 Tax=Motilimonas sp. KMU-193 TaxID=3388668 RepID=UPI00396B3A66
MALLRGCLRFFRGVIVFFALFYLSFVIAPYLLGVKSVPTEQQPDISFPVLYQTATGYNVLFHFPDGETGQVVTSISLKGQLANNEHFALEQEEDGLLHLTYYADDYTYWSGYYVNNDEIIAKYYRFVGAFIVIPVFGILGVLYLFGKMAWQWRRRVNRAKNGLSVA